MDELAQAAQSWMSEQAWELRRAEERISELEHRLSGALADIERAKAIYADELRKSARLERAHSRLMTDFITAERKVTRLEREVATLREALQDVRDGGYSTCDECGRLVDRARAALEAADAQATGD